MSLEDTYSNALEECIEDFEPRFSDLAGWCPEAWALICKLARIGAKAVDLPAGYKLTHSRHTGNWELYQSVEGVGTAAYYLVRSAERLSEALDVKEKE